MAKQHTRRRLAASAPLAARRQIARPPHVPARARMQAAPRPAPRDGLIRTARPIFWLLFGINCVNYLDRLIALAFGATLKSEFHLTDGDIGFVSSAFLLIYTLAAVPMGLLADRLSRARVVAAGVALWSVASGATAFVGGFFGLMLTRAGVGIGEASYLPAGTALLSAYYPLERRARAISRWGASQLVGVAAAFALSACLARIFGPHLAWRLAFIFTAPPGLLLAFLMLRVADSPAGKVTTTRRRPKRRAAAPRDYRQMAALFARVEGRRILQALRIRTVAVVVVLQALTFVAVTPTLTFLTIYAQSDKGPFHLSVVTAQILTGVIVVIGGLAGSLLGGYVADWFSRRFAGGRMLAATFGFGLALPAFVLMLVSHSIVVFLIAGLVTVFSLTVPPGPLTAAAQDVTPPALRATAIAVALTLSHLLGDVWSPGVVGSISTKLGERSDLALLIIGTPALALATLAGIVGARIYARDLARLAAPAPKPAS